MRNATSLRLLESYHSRLIQIADRAAGAAQRRMAQVDEDDLAQGFRDFVEDTLPIYEAAQAASLNLATAFYSLYRSNETGDEEEPAEALEPGESRNGATLEVSLTGATIKVYKAIKDGREPFDALRFGAKVAQRTVHTEVLDAAQREVTNQMTNDPRSNGWRWKSAGTCAACAAMDNGGHLPAGTPLNRHPYCVCVAEPTFKGVRDRERRTTGAQRMLDLPLSRLIDEVGVEKAEKLKAGDITLDDLVSVDHAPGFVPFVTEKPLQDV